MLASFVENISKWNTIVGLIVVVLAFALMLAAKPLAQAVCKNKPPETVQKVALAFKMIALVLAVAGCIVVMFIQ